MKSDSEIVRCYEHNEWLNSQEVRRLYQIVGDPWNFKSAEYSNNMNELVATISSLVEMSSCKYVIDFGGGVGAFSHAVKSIYPDIKTIGIDFDSAMNSSIYGAYDEKIVLIEGENERDLMKRRLPYCLDPSDIVFFNLLNSAYYLFLELPQPAIERMIGELVLHLTGGYTPKYVCVSGTGWRYEPAYNACALLGLKELSEFSLPLDNPNPAFRGDLISKLYTNF